MQTEKVAVHIVNWLKAYANNAGIHGFVIGVSGGIDSAVTSTLCALTGLKTICVTMPIHQAKIQVTRADEHISFLKNNYTNVLSEEVDLTSVFEEFISKTPVSKQKALGDLSLANTRARLRMTTLYYIAGINQLLVVGTGNKIEDFGVGFFTKYGDGGVDISPIADLLKSEVYHLAKHLQVPKSIQSAPPTDGLFGDDRTDEEQLGATYDELEWAMKMHEKQVDSNRFSKREQEVYNIYLRLHKANQHKMNPIPVCEIPDDLRG